MIVMEALNAVNNAGMRTMLLVLVLVAVVLLITGAVITVMTFYNLRKAIAARSASTRLENKKS